MTTTFYHHHCYHHLIHSTTKQLSEILDDNHNNHNDNNRFHDLIGGIHVPVDDGVDKLNRKYTLLVFLFLALPIFTKQYIGDPIECFTPTYFTEPQARYVNSYCWTASTYYLVAAEAEEDDYESFTGQVSYILLYFCLFVL